MGFRVVASDGNPAAPGFAVADRQIVADTYNPQETALLAEDFSDGPYGPVDGVLALCADVPYTVAYVADTLGLPGLPLAVAHLGRNKLAMKRHLQASGVQTAKGAEVASLSQLRRLQAQLGGTVVVKPIDSRGARGVTILKPQGDAGFAWDAAMSSSPSQRVMIEEWLDGPQISIESICYGGTHFTMSTPGFLDRNYSRLAEFAPFVIEDGADGPTRLDFVDRTRVELAFAKAAEAVVGKTPCTVKGDMVLTPDGPKIIELALRLSGGYMSTDLVPRSTGVDLVGAAIRLALGETLDPANYTKQFERGIAIRYNIPMGAKCHPDRLGHVICESMTRDAAVGMAESIIRHG